MEFNLVEIVVYYVVVLFIFYKNEYRLSILLVLIVVIDLLMPYLDSSSYVYLFDVGQGDSSLIISSFRREVILIDTGGSQNYDVSSGYISFLKSMGVKSIDWLVISHGDYDHMGEAVNLVNNFTVKKVVFNCGEFNELEQDLIKVLDKKKISYYSCIKELYVDNQKLYFLNNKDYGNENDNSSVIYTELNNHKFLFMGDAGVEVEEDLIEKYNLNDIDVLKVGHHGSKTSSSKEFINKIEPKSSIISVGKNNRYGHPNKEVLNNLSDSIIYRTDKDGSVMFKTKNNKLKVETCSS
jgi:competence protein ComEC